MKIFNAGEIDFKSFVKKGVPKVDSPFGNFLICGVMGSGKSYLAVKHAFNLKDKYKIKTNIHSLHIPGYEIEYFNEINEILKDTEPFCLYIIDELGKKYTKENKQDKDFYNWLQHSRKLKRITFLIHQEYLLVPNWLRGACKEVYTTKKIPFLPLFLTIRGVPILNPDTLEWQVDSNYFYLYKRISSIANLYNTFEVVSTL